MWCGCNNVKQSAYYCNSKSTDAKGCKILRMAILEGVAKRSVLDIVALGAFPPPPFLAKAGEHAIQLLLPRLLQHTALADPLWGMA